MTPSDLDADQLLGALGDLQRVERAELARFDEPARALAAREPARVHAFESRLVSELCGEAAPAVRARRIGRGWSLAAASCALAAAALLMARAAPGSFDLQYTLVPPAPDANSRAPASTPLPAADAAYSLGRTISFTLRPAVRYSGALRVLAYAAKDGALLQLDPKLELDPAGGARVIVATGPGSPLATAGSWQLQFYISPVSVPMPSAAELRGHNCPASTRCLGFSARLVQPESL